MSKYLCVSCGGLYGNKIGCQLHVEYNPEHIIVKQTLRGRIRESFVDFFFGTKWLRILGFITIHGIFVYHFKYSLWESILSALALGLII